MAAEGEGSFLERLLRAASGGGRAGFFPIVVGVMDGSGEEAEVGEDAPAAAADRIVLVNPVTQGMVVLPGDAAEIAEILSGRGDARKGPPPASKASIEALSTVEPAEAEEEEEECTVCLDALRAAAEDRVTVREMPCRHRFHGACIEKWLGMHGSCPVCRYRMPAEEAPEPPKGSAAAVDGEEGGGRRRGREIWVTIAFTGRRRADQQQQQQEQTGE